MLMRNEVFGVMIGALILSQPAVEAGVIYNLDGGEVSSLIESSATDPLPLFGVPIVVGDSLTFSTGPFAAAQAGVGSDITAGQLSFVIQADPGLFIESISLDEIGDFLMLGSTAEVTAGGTLVATILDPQLGGFVSDAIGIDPLVPLTGTGSGIWSGEATVDLSQYRVTRVRIDLDNILIASSGAGPDAAFIDKKALTVDVDFTEVPEPATLALLGLGLIAFARRS
jgi:PEP-CTERM motif